MATLKKLVNNDLWRVPKFPLTSICDVFNAVGERIERWTEYKSREELLLLLKAGSLMVTKTTVDPMIKVDNVKVGSNKFNH